MTHIVYPECRNVPDTTIAAWYADAVANDECEPGAQTILEMAASLDDAGLITLGD